MTHNTNHGGDDGDEDGVEGWVEVGAEEEEGGDSFRAGQTRERQAEGGVRKLKCRSWVKGLFQSILSRGGKF